MTTKLFVYDGKTFEVITVLIGQQYVVRVFENGVHASKVAYGITLEIAQDAYPWDVVAEMVDLAEKDFIRWRDWQKEEAARQRSSSN